MSPFARLRTLTWLPVMTKELAALSSEAGDRGVYRDSYGARRIARRNRDSENSRVGLDVG